MHLSSRLTIARTFAFLATLAVALVACKGMPASSSLPGALAGAQQLEPSRKVRPDIFRMHPFKKGKKLGESAGQPVYALFAGDDISLASASPSLASTPDVTVFGALAVQGKAGPLAQIAVESSSTSKQNLYVDARSRIFELSDVASGALMLVTYPQPGEVLTVVCKSGRSVGEIVEITSNGVTTTRVKRDHRLSCQHVTGAVFPPSDSPHAIAHTPAVSLADVQFDSCVMGSNPTVFASASDKFDVATKLIPALMGTGDLQAAIGSRFAQACSNPSIIALSPPTAPPACPGSACPYVAPPVPLTVATAACPTGSGTAVTFNAPGQTCPVSAPYNVSSSTSFTVTTSSAAIVSVSPTSGTVNGSGTEPLTFTAGSLGGTATVVFGAGGQSTTYSVDNAWTSSSSSAIASLAFALPATTLALGQQMSFGIVAKNVGGQTIVGTYDNPIALSGTNLAISPTSVPNSATAAQLTAGWNQSFAGTANGTITATADGVTATATIAPGTGVAYYPVGNDAATDDFGFQMAYGPDANIYYTVLGPDTCLPSGFCYPNAAAVGQFNPSTGAWNEIPLPGTTGAYGLIFTSDGALWIAGGLSHNVYRFPPGSFTASAMQTIPVPSPSPSATYFPRNMMTDGTNVWFTDGPGGRIFKNPIAGPYDGSALTPYVLPTGPPGTVQTRAWADGIQYGNDGNVYVADRFNGVVDEFGPSDAVTEQQIVTPQETAYGLTYYGYPGPNFMTQDASGTLYFTLIGETTATLEIGGVDSLVPGSGTINAVSLPSSPGGAEGYGISANGSYVYYADYYGGLGLINAGTGQSRLYRLQPVGLYAQTPAEVLTLPDGTAWFTCYGGNGPPLCLGHTVYLSGWSLEPGPAFTISGYGSPGSQPVGIMEAPSANSGPFTATNSNTSVCQLSSVVDHNFVITGLSQGMCTVVVTDAHSKSAQLQVTVQPTPVPTPTPSARRKESVHRQLH